MKKLLLISLLGSFFAPFSVSAGEWEFDITGTGKGIYGYSAITPKNKKHSHSNQATGSTEINTSAIYTFDNQDYNLGIFLDIMGGVDKELKNYNQGTWGEEVYSIADTPYGRVMIGQTYNVAAQFYEGSPTTGAFASNSDIVDFMRNPNWIRNNKTTRFSTLNSVYINTDGVAPKFSYISPEFKNTSIGLSYIPETYNRRGLVNKHAPYANKDGFVTALHTYQELSGININFSAAVAQFHDDDKELSTSINLQYGNWSLGGGYRKTYVDGTEASTIYDSKLPFLYDTYREAHSWEIGIGYEFGPFKSSISYFESQADNLPNQDKIWTLSNQYQVNKYLNIFLAVAHVNFEDYSHNIYDNNQGWVFASGIGLNF